ncbi:hypothetical protein [Aquisphaera giovannonii]|uniref:hypothetical protein n=1 Tax=Aquisphaera giovannonii TaxID=406548 RepID=UPI0011DF17F9|nr:hypothetical protein [Aquisphaera giovannonii]
MLQRTPHRHGGYRTIEGRSGGAGPLSSVVRRLKRVLDVIGLNPRWTFRYPHLAAVGPGVLLVFASGDSPSPPVAGGVVQVERRDGTIAAYEVFFSERRPGAFGVAIPGLDAAEIDIGANVEW